LNTIRSSAEQVLNGVSGGNENIVDRATTDSSNGSPPRAMFSPTPEDARSRRTRLTRANAAASGTLGSKAASNAVTNIDSLSNPVIHGRRARWNKRCCSMSPEVGFGALGGTV